MAECPAIVPLFRVQLAGREGGGLTNLQYGDLAEIMGTSNHIEFAAQCTNCTSPDTGNMEVLARFGTEEQKKQWLEPLLAGRIRSCFGMTEPNVASSDAANIGIEIVRDKDEYVINGQKWWITGAGSLHCKIMILMGKTDPSASKYEQQSQILVPMDTPGITLLRPMTVFGDDDAPKGHMEIEFEDVRVPVRNVVRACVRLPINAGQALPFRALPSVLLGILWLSLWCGAVLRPHWLRSQRTDRSLQPTILC
eukprot:SAG22_NODE_296_length_12811_cov_14.899780_17_plen_252_part_00